MSGALDMVMKDGVAVVVASAAPDTVRLCVEGARAGGVDVALSAEQATELAARLLKHVVILRQHARQSAARKIEADQAQ